MLGVELEGDGLEVASLSETLNPRNSGIFWLGTEDEEDKGCYFTTRSIRQDLIDSMLNGWNDFVNNYLPEWMG